MRLHFLLALFFSFLTVSAFSQRQKTPMYFSAYAYLYTVNQNQPTTLPMDESRWRHNIDYISEHLAPLGFDMICTDGWGEDIRNISMLILPLQGLGYFRNIHQLISFQ